MEPTRGTISHDMKLKMGFETRIQCVTCKWKKHETCWCQVGRRDWFATC